MTLTELADFFEQNPNAWCQDAGARDADGREVLPDNPDAVQWCIWGCIYKFGISYYAVHDRINESLPGWNDNPGRTVQDVITMLRKP